MELSAPATLPTWLLPESHLSLSAEKGSVGVTDEPALPSLFWEKSPSLPFLAQMSVPSLFQSLTSCVCHLVVVAESLSLILSHCYIPSPQPPFAAVLSFA